MMHRLAALSFFVLAVAGCGDDDVVPTLASGSYDLVRSSAGEPLPIVIRSSADGEAVLAEGSVMIWGMGDGQVPPRGQLMLRVDAGPLGGPHLPFVGMTSAFVPEQRGNRLILRYTATAGAPAPLGPDTLVIAPGRTLRGDVHVPLAATDRVGVVFRWVSER